MATLSICDLPSECTLDHLAMAHLQGGGAPWVYGWIRSFSDATVDRGAAVNFYQINNFADQIINQFQMVDVTNAAANSTVNVVVDERSLNTTSHRLAG